MNLLGKINKPLIIVNLEANEKRAFYHWKKTGAHLRKHGIESDVEFTNNRLDSVNLVKKDKKHKIILSYSGDGGMNAVLEGAMQNDSDKIIGTIPGGTANDISKIFNITNPKKLYSALLNETSRLVDVGEVNGKYFLAHASIGFDALVLHERNKRRFLKGKLAYYPAVFRALSKYKSRWMQIKTDDEKTERETFMAVVSNIPYYADGMEIAPKAKTDDHLLDLCLIEGKSGLGLLLHSLSFLYSQHHLDNSLVYYCQTKKLEISSPEPVFLQADGDIICENNYFKFGLAGRKIHMLCCD
ncbi:MAG: YegS/Rv2252/BmrU family lipid kinase [Candidatus Nanoarchaeia archaeon]|nr:YegS/Rv2252/BmrU family lipid kinase [Candidatus Nanoarchaeia archaeon]MDD5357595.1 YegS/Rv2252/BmrU family lipid kinase [Candidatus Nanoarchaeia archaeon]MDD5588514.1 YegS/Rv2252/BmrU family lipid kinase [Candidatus Nanoarchaeia archaeon]